MKKFPISQNHSWNQANSGKMYGDFYSTFNCNFDKEGFIKQQRLPVSIYSSVDDADFTTPVSIQNNGSTIYVLTESGLFTVNGITVAQVTTTNQPTFSQFSDGIMWGTNFYAAGGDLKYYNGSSWNNTGLGGGTTTPISLAVFESLAYLAMAYGNQVELIDSTHTIVETLIIPDEYWITSIKYRAQNLYIATRHQFKGEAKLFIWNGNGAAAQASYGVQSDYIFSLTEYDSSIVAVTKAGQILRFNGGGFTSIANFPVYYADTQWNFSDATAGSSRQLMGNVRNRGTVAFGDVLYINVSNEIRNNQSQASVNGYYLDNMPSGVWCYDPKVGLYHYASQTADKYTSFTVSSLASDTLTLSANTNAKTGDAVYVNDVGSLTGITASGSWSGYLIKVASNQIKLARTRADAFSGDNIAIGGSVTSASIFIPTYKNLGNINAGFASAIGIVNYGENSYPRDVFSSFIIYGASCSDSTTVTTRRTALNILANSYAVSRIQLQRQYASGVTLTPRMFTLKYSNLWLDDDKIYVKYKTTDRLGLPTNSTNNETAARAATWTNSTTFTVSEGTVVGVIPSLHQVAVGDECVITQGSGAPHSAHVSSISENAGTWTVVLDEAIPNVSASDTCAVVFTAFKRLETITNASQFNSYGIFEVKLPTDATGRFVDIALEIRGNGIEIEDAYIHDKVDRPLL